MLPLLQLKVHNVYTVQNLGYPPQQECPINFPLLVFASVCYCKISGSSAFSIFCHKVLYHKVRKVTDPNFEEKKNSVGLGLEGSKSLKNTPKIKFLGFQQKSYSFRYAFLLQHHSANGLYDQKSMKATNSRLLQVGVVRHG